MNLTPSFSLLVCFRSARTALLFSAGVLGVACGSSSEDARPVADAGDASTVPDEPPLPDAESEPKSAVTFPGGVAPYAYDRIAVGADGSVTIGASRYQRAVVLGYDADFVRRYVTLGSEESSRTAAGTLVAREGGAATLRYRDVDSITREGWLLSVGADGKRDMSTRDEPGDYGGALAVDGVGRLLFGELEGTDAGRHATVVRKTARGTLDTNFGGAGRAVLSCTVGGVALDTSGPSSIAAGGDGAAYASLTASGNVGGAFGVYTMIAKIRADGSMDPTFGQGGCAPITLEAPNQLVVRRDGAVWVGGQTTLGPSGVAGVLRLSKSGAVDATLGTNGVYLFAHLEGSGSSLRSLHALGSDMVALVDRYVQGQKLQTDLVRLTAGGAERTITPDSKYMDFALSSNEKNLYYLLADRAGRIATPR
jgi:hypothetical protein